ncbi:MAG: site-2 protease family protein [Oscillospiraceae bacterium]|nr:site-2 protease family protein [Oscillospiraceae bacterium]
MDGIFRNFSNIGDYLNVALMRIIPALICITIHELAHGFTAFKLGDNTAKDMGRLTLNPIKHIDPLGLLLMLLMGFGWAKPVPVNMNNFKHPKWGMAITAFAGPLSNILLASVAMFLYGLFVVQLLALEAGESIVIMMLNTVYLSVALAIFNMLPIPPLDGSKVLFSLLPEGLYYKLMRVERYGIIILIIVMNSGLLFGFDILSGTIGRLSGTIIENLAIFSNTAFSLVN